MAKYVCTEEVEAVQWYKTGGHKEMLILCEKGLFPEQGDYIITHADGTIDVMKTEEFERKFRKKVEV